MDPTEQAKFERLAKDWWDITGPFKPLHALNRFRTDYICKRICSHFHRDYTEHALQGLRILDIGCGGGLLSEAMAALDADVHGIDVVEPSIQIAKQHAQQSDLDICYEAITAKALLDRGQQYDIVLNMEVVEHVADIPGFIQTASELVAPGGIIFIATINRSLQAMLFAILAAEYVLRILPRGTHQWRKFVKPAELTKQLEDNGLSVIDITGVGVNPFNYRFWLRKSLAVNYMVVATRHFG